MPAWVFDYRTAYANSWQQFPPGAVEDGELRIRTAEGTLEGAAWQVHVLRHEISPDDWSTFAQVLLAQADAVIWHCWPEVGDLTDTTPGLDDHLIVDGVTYLIRGVGKGHHGARWTLATVRSLDNA